MGTGGNAKLASGAPVRLDKAEMRLLATMRLRAITSVHGEAGLRERLLLEIARFPAADRARAEKALALASRLRAADRRQRQPYATKNAVGLICTTGPKLTKLAGKYRPLVPVLRELILRPDTPLGPEVKEMIAGQLDNAEARFAAIAG